MSHRAPWSRDRRLSGSRRGQHHALTADAARSGSPSVALDHALRGANLWRGDPTEICEPWALSLIERQRRRFAAVATRAGELLLAQGNVEGAQTLAERVLEAEPWLEAGHRLLVASHRANSDDLSVRRALDRYEEAAREHGFSPSEATRMVERLLGSVPPRLVADVAASPAP